MPIHKQLMQNIASKFELSLPKATKQQIAAIITLLLIDDYHREYVPKHDLLQMLLAVIGNEPSKGFAKSPIERVYEFATSNLIRMPYICLYDEESASYILSGETRGFGY